MTGHTQRTSLPGSSRFELIERAQSAHAEARRLRDDFHVLAEEWSAHSDPPAASDEQVAEPETEREPI